VNEQEQRTYMEKYHEAKEKGVPFFPDIVFKDAIVSLVVFIILLALAYFVGAPLEARANPADTNYTPRPEWYFLFLFQLLKYFPGKLEVIGVIVLPTIAIVLLFFLPLLDRSPRRHFLKRPVITSAATLAVAGVALLTFLAVREAPPPAAAASGDQTAALYANNCAPCHGASLTVPPGTNLHQVIAQGKHEGMPAWGADLSTDQIDALAGFILSPGGSQLFTQYCSACHQTSELVATNPQELKRAIEEGLSYPAHANAKISDWTTALSADERSRLLNFLAAPDGERLFATNCAPCHGEAVAFSGSADGLRGLIAKGGLHLDMPPWQEKLSQSEIEALANYVVNPAAEPNGKQLFDQNCMNCHGERVPTAASVDAAQQVITSGGPHQTMPIWGDVLTAEQLDALVQYTFQAAQGTSLATGQQLFAANCAPCHGQFGEGGPNPAQPSYLLSPISSAEFLKTRDDATLQAIISQGQPDLGMTPFGSAFGGPLEDADIEAIIAYMRAWEANPPAVQPSTPLPPAPTPATTPATTTPSFSADVVPILQTKCVVCHGALGGWDASSYTSLMTSGIHAPVVIAGDAANSLLAQKLLGTQTFGVIMPPAGKLSDIEIQIIINWINAGALEK
jgi:mono/diheme cytochrome c family protein